uniref:Uncharacterized protein n=1 Tax=Eutreptiella gymnastica TaxID=73025 RepID=A0A7S4C7Q1_9EUGL
MHRGTGAPNATRHRPMPFVPTTAWSSPSGVWQGAAPAFDDDGGHARPEAVPLHPLTVLSPEHRPRCFGFEPRDPPHGRPRECATELPLPIGASGMPPPPLGQRHCWGTSNPLRHPYNNPHLPVSPPSLAIESGRAGPCLTLNATRLLPRFWQRVEGQALSFGVVTRDATWGGALAWRRLRARTETTILLQMCRSHPQRVPLFRCLGNPGRCPGIPLRGAMDVCTCESGTLLR